MSTTLSNTASLIRPNVAPDLTDLEYTDTDLLNWFETRGFVRPNDGGAPYLWDIKTGSTIVGETFVEGQALPVPGSPAFTQASVPAFYQRTVARITGHVRDQDARRGFYQSPREITVDSMVRKLRVLIDSTLAGSAANRGFLSIIDADDLYGGLDPASVTQWAALETNVAGALTLSALQTAYRSVIDTPRGGNPTDILVALLQLQRYTDLGSAAASSGVQWMPRSEMGKPFDLGMMRTPASFNGAPFTPIRSLATSELLMLDVSVGIELREQRPLEVETLAKTNDDETLQASRALIPVVRNRRRQAKLRGRS